VIKHFAANTADAVLRHSVLPRAPNAGANGFHGTGMEKLDHIAAELGVTVEQDVAVGTGKRQSLAQLLYDPVAGRMLRDVAEKGSAGLPRLIFIRDGIFDDPLTVSRWKQ